MENHDNLQLCQNIEKIDKFALIWNYFLNVEIFKFVYNDFITVVKSDNKNKISSSYFEKL